MRVDDERLKWIALVALQECVERAKDGALPPSYAVRLALAVAYNFSRDGDRGPFEDFWRQMQDDCEKSGTPTIARYCRPTFLQTQLRGVMRAVGVEPCVATELPLQEAARKAMSRKGPTDGI